MMQSMTGFGSSSSQTKLGRITVELKALNSKQLDLSIRIPKEFSNLESQVRQLISSLNQRGKITCLILLDSESSVEVEFNKSLADSYLMKLSEFAQAHAIQQVDYLSIIARMPEVFGGNINMDEEDEKILLQCVEVACGNLNLFRVQEGLETEKAIHTSLSHIQNSLSQVESLDTERISAMKEKFESWVKEKLNKAAFDGDRFEQELIYYLEKLDVSEEKQRLSQHLNYFQTTMSEPQSGRKLGFIAQEMGREINTLGSKANHFGIQQKVVEMKNELEKIKEQVLNIL